MAYGRYERKALACKIAARTKPRFIDTNPVPVDRKAVACTIAARSMPRFITIARERRSQVRFTDEELTAMRGGVTAEEYRWKPIRKQRKKP
jgi:hypothetical protein